MPKLKASPTNNSGIVMVGLGLKPEEKAERILVRLNAKKRLIEMDENGKMCNRVGVEMMKLQIESVKKATKKITSGEGQSPFTEVTKTNDFLLVLKGIQLMKRRAPPD